MEARPAKSPAPPAPFAPHHKQPPAWDAGWFGIRSALRFRADSLGVLMAAAQMGARHGHIVDLRFGPVSRFLVSHPDWIRQIYVEQAAKFYKSAQLKEVLGPLLGNGLLVSDGDFWRRQRKLAQPAFHHKRIEGYANTMVDFTQRMLNTWDNVSVTSTRDIDQDMMQLTMEIVAKCLFNADVTSDAAGLGEAITTGNELASARFTKLFTPPTWVPTRDNKRAARAIDTIDQVLMRFIHQRRAEGLDALRDRSDLLSTLLAAVDEDGGGGMTDKQARDEAFTLFVAGHETTATTLTWVWYLLSQNPAAEAKLHEELERVLGGRTPTVADLAQLPFTDWIIKETLRLYPVAWITSREAIEPVQVGEYAFDKGAVFFLSPYVLHHDATYFEAPEEFRPERWAGDFEKQLPRFTYFPFGGGPRVCIGNTFALMEAQLILATIAQRFQMRLAPGHVVEPLPLITLRSKYGLRMEVASRQ